MCGFAVMTAKPRPRRCSRGGSSTNGRRMRQSLSRLREIRSTISMDSWIRPTFRRPIAPMTGEDRRNILIIENDNDSLLKRNCPRKWSCWPASTTMSVARSWKSSVYSRLVGAMGIPSCCSATACCPLCRSSSNCEARQLTSTRTAMVASMQRKLAQCKAPDCYSNTVGRGSWGRCLCPARPVRLMVLLTGIATPDSRAWLRRHRVCQDY